MTIAGSAIARSLTRVTVRIENVAADTVTLRSNGVDTTVQGPNGGPLAPGVIREFTFTVEANNPSNRFLSYAFMVLLSNDICVSNGNPSAHQIFDESGNFIAQSFFCCG